GPRRARGPHVQDPLIESLGRGVRRDVLADDPPPLREQPPGGDLLVPATLLCHLAEELADRLRIPRVRPRARPAAPAQTTPGSDRTRPSATDLLALGPRPCPGLLEGLPGDVITTLWRLRRCFSAAAGCVGHSWAPLPESVLSSSSPWSLAPSGRGGAAPDPPASCPSAGAGSSSDHRGDSVISE